MPSTLRSYLMILSATLAVALSGCTADSLESTSDVQIYGGTEVPNGKWSNTVALFMGSSLCTGTLVTPTLVITAAHCVDSLSPGDPITVIVGNDADAGQRFQSQSFAKNPEYRDDALTDIAYVKLSQPALNVAMTEILTDPEETRLLLAPGAQAVMVGFGQRESGQIGTKYETTSVVGPDQDGALFVGGGGKDSCQGDSGGPAFGQLANGQWRVYGIVSRGNGCGEGGLLARMTDGLCWIQKDSGIAVPGSKLECDGVINVPGGAGPLNLLLAESPATAPSDTAIAAPKDTVKVGLCFGNKAACDLSKTIDVAYDKLDKTSADYSFFKSKAPLILSSGLVLTMLAFDGSGALVASSSVSIAPN